MYIVIEIYILICIFLLIFDIIFLLIQNRKNLAAYRLNEQLANEIRTELNKNPDELSLNFLKRLGTKLDKTKNLLTLQSVMEEYPKQKNLFRSSVLAQLDNYSKKRDYEQAYYTYLLSAFDYSQEKPSLEFINALLRFLDSKSIYIVSNTMDALYAIGMIEPLLCAIKKADERKGFQHKKLLVDGLLSAKVNRSEFNEQLLKAFEYYSPYMKECLLDYFRMDGYDISSLCLKIIKSEDEDTQVVYSAMRYFIKYPNEEARRVFLGILADPNGYWIRQMLAIQALHAYKDAEVRQAVQEKITHSNWYVRVNAVEYLYNCGLSKEQLHDIIQLRDRYTNECLIYQYRNDKEMIRYIDDTIRLLNMQDSSSETGSEINAENAAALCT